jgi:hypothetical protein
VEQSAYRQIFRDIVRGYSEVTIDGSLFYIKHLSALDQVEIDEVRDRYFKIALDKGLSTQKDILQSLRKDNIWTEEDENKISRLKLFIQRAIDSKTQLVLKSQIDQQNKIIRDSQDEIDQLEKKKNDLMGINAESYADQRANDYYIIKSFYEDSDLQDPTFPDEKDFNELYSEDIAKFINVYNKTFKNFEEITIQSMILQDFYYIYFPFSDDTVGFFGNPVCHLTYNQLKLIVYTKIFKNIFENNRHIPENIKKDPKALLDYGSISDEAKQKMKEQMDSSKDGTTLFGATDEDYEYAGLDKPSDSAGMSLQKAAKEKGGSLSMKDLMEMSGHG